MFSNRKQGNKYVQNILLAPYDQSYKGLSLDGGCWYEANAIKKYQGKTCLQARGPFKLSKDLDSKGAQTF